MPLTCSLNENIPHPYLEGYNALPKLHKLNSPVFQIDENRNHYLNEKQLALKSQICFVEHDIKPEVYETICNYIVQNYPEKLKEPYTFQNIAQQIQEDLVIHQINEQTDWTAAIHACFPGGWLPENQIGKSFEQIHQPVPEMNLKNSRKLAETMVYHGPFERYVWNLAFSNDINSHPSRLKPIWNNTQLWIKFERQVIIGFPKHQAALFVIRQYLLPEQEIDKPKLIEALKQMNDAQKIYKGLDRCFDEVIEYLRKTK